MSVEAGGQQSYVSTFKVRLRAPRAAKVPGSADAAPSDSGPPLAEPPVFAEPLQDCCVDEGDDITLRGVLSGSRPVNVTWLHNGEAARFGIPTQNGDGVSFVVRNCLPEDAGAYTCLAENAAGKTSGCAAVFVRDFETIHGVQTLKATKSTMGIGKPRHAPQEPENPPASSSPTSGLLQSPVSSLREVVPKKRANSATGPVLRFEKPPQHVEVKAGHPARVTCRFTCSPPVVSCWIRNKEQMVDGPEVWTENLDDSSTLVLTAAGVQHTGSYTVVVKDRKSSAQHTLTLSVIDRPQPPASCPLVSLLSPGSLVLSWSGPSYDGGSAVLGYVVEVNRGRDWTALTSGCKSTSYRVCAGLQPGDQYRFRVRAYNTVGVSEPGPPSPVVTLDDKKVVPKKRANSATGPVLRFEKPPQHVEVKAGHPARVTCRFTCSPPVVSCWIRNKEQMVDGPEVWTENLDDSSTLVLTAAGVQHTGSYTVVVKDRKSSAQHTLTLSVIDRPQPPASCPLVSLLSPGSLVLSWSGPSYDGGSAVLGYVVEVNRGRDWTALTSGCKSTSYRVCAGLQPGDEYRFRVRAYNTVGVSEPGPPSPVVTLDDKKSDCAPPEEEFCRDSLVTMERAHKVTDHYHVLEKLGMGKFGLVFKLRHKESGRVCAGKFYKGRRAKEREAAGKEIELMNKLHHPKLVRCLAAYDHKPEIVMVMEFIAGGELFERIVDDSFEHTEPASVRYMLQILQGVSFMHQQSIVHLDLKPENIVCVDTTGTAIKIIDFGLASQLDNRTPLKVMQGTPEFVAPEVINYEPVCLATDMWSIGVICYILLSGESPFQGSSDADTLALVTAAQWEFEEESFEEITEQAKHFISSLLEKDPRRRMSCDEALAHPWMAAFDSGDPASTKSLPKDKMKKFLARQKWKKAGKAMLALKRMALLSKGDSSSSLTSPTEDSPLSPETEHALIALERKMQGPPNFTETLQDQAVSVGSSAHLSCHVTGYPDPDVVWLCGGEPVEESPSARIEYEEDGRCTLILAEVGPGDSNIYACRAANEHGETICSASLVVQNPH
ncbi:myosin light chain kinase, smooth muscle isoform X1 [Nerophis ophidion]|uniref:myosin light chain kinase, smooth muscle isoform X1 n=1 Tax=Nerophis ophidion TaxID=159077 RepID=UPI002AE008CC|nr:myosin light chain kinase, smooth muscle isoform X1 [Nerophis ophidion]